MVGDGWRGTEMDRVQPSWTDRDRQIRMGQTEMDGDRENMDGDLDRQIRTATDRVGQRQAEMDREGQSQTDKDGDG